MYRCLSPGAIGVKADLEEGLRLAKLGGFGGLEVGIGDIARRIDEQGQSAVLDLFREAEILPGAWGLPVDWRTPDESKFEADLEKLPRLAAAGAAIGCTRTATWFMSFSDERNYEENTEWHVRRFSPIARILADHGCSLGLEFLGPKTIYDGHHYEFVHDMNAALDLAGRIGPNVGLLLDCWHWYHAENTTGDIRKTSPDKIVYVHVNDAPAGRPKEEMKDSPRCLPGETGVIDITAFLQALQEIGYDGPVTPEPFSETLKNTDSQEEKVRITGASMKKIWRQAGLS
ncbi:MAG: sugar phosphate isomerase/epimerase [Armatimonadetes bacterium]|nr:sugar phosphate isomerase/epimerase [Armatimonadota bacterium]